MGCHTWFTLGFPIESNEAKEVIKREAMEWLKGFSIVLVDGDLIIDGTCTLDYLLKSSRDTVKLAYAYHLEDYDTMLKILVHEKEITKTRNGLILDDDLKKVPAHDWFRIGGYPDTVITNHDELNRFLRKHPYCCSETPREELLKRYDELCKDFDFPVCISFG